jgi:hypothetical protein
VEIGVSRPASPDSEGDSLEKGSPLPQYEQGELNPMIPLRELTGGRAQVDL